ncbi:MAG: acyl-CoA dehydrogenase family protein [Acidimicrobiia bacterium]
MDFEDTPAEAEFRAEARSWLETHAEPRSDDSSHGVLSVLGRESDSPDDIAVAREWQAKAAGDGWAGISWPTEYGGRGATFMEQVIWGQECARFDVPDSVFRIGVSLGGPTVIAHGTENQKRRFLPPLLMGEEIWCQLFSEPGAGSDLASLRTGAVADGDEWIINGQKVWSSGAHYSKWGFLLARTDPDVPKHQGITWFLLDMEASGIEIRPLRQMTGLSHFNEVFFDDVRIPDGCRVGDLHDGWRVAQTTLLHERSMMGEFGAGGIVDALVAAAKRQAAEEGVDPRTRQDLADLHVRAETVRFIGLRIITAISQGGFPGAEASVAKLAMARLLNDAGALGIRISGPAAVVKKPDEYANEWWETLLAAPALRIAGGSDEVQRNIIGERVLGLPKEPGPPRDTPFRDLLTS